METIFGILAEFFTHESQSIEIASGNLNHFII